MYLIRPYLFFITGVVKLWVLLNIQVSTNSKGWPRLEFDSKSNYSIMSCIDVMFKGSEIGAGKSWQGYFTVSFVLIGQKSAAQRTFKL